MEGKKRDGVGGVVAVLSIFYVLIADGFSLEIFSKDSNLLRIPSALFPTNFILRNFLLFSFLLIRFLFDNSTHIACHDNIVLNHLGCKVQKNKNILKDKKILNLNKCFKT